MARIDWAERSAVVLLVSVAVAAQPPADRGRLFLATSFGITSAEIARVDAGQVIARPLAASDKRELGTIGVVRIGISPEFYVERLGDIATFKRDDAILQIGTFRNPPRYEDVAGLTLDESDFRSLRSCEIGSCGVQLSAEAIERFQRDVDWRRADAPLDANRVMRQILVEYVAAYRESGSQVSMLYADQPDAVDLGREFVALARADVPEWQPFLRLRQHLFDGPSETPATRDVLYWSKEMVGRRPVVSVTHLAITNTSTESAADYAIASKHIYGTHYFVASLGLTVLVRAPAPALATYVVYVNRSRIDLFDGTMGPIIRRVVGRKARALVSEQLERMRSTLEREFTTNRR
jgi:hypothetical protein